jgi:hypothetical protein
MHTLIVGALDAWLLAEPGEWLDECSKNISKNEKKRIEIFFDNAYGPTRFWFRLKQKKISHASEPFMTMSSSVYTTVHKDTPSHLPCILYLHQQKIFTFTTEVFSGCSSILNSHLSGALSVIGNLLGE